MIESKPTRKGEVWISHETVLEHCAMKYMLYLLLFYYVAVIKDHGLSGSILVWVFLMLVVRAPALACWTHGLGHNSMHLT